MKLVILTTHPIQYQVPWFRLLHEDPQVDLKVLFCMIPDARQQGAGFGVEFQWDVPLLEGYEHEVLMNEASIPSVTSFKGCDTPRIATKLKELDPDVVLVNGWVVKSCLQTLWACKRLGIPCMVRGEANLHRRRAWWKEVLQGLLVRRYAACLAIGDANREFYLRHWVPENKIFDTPYSVDNDFFFRSSEKARERSSELRKKWALPDDRLILLFVGKFETKKHPELLLESLKGLEDRVHLLMVGEGELSEASREQATALPVTFAGFLNQSQLPEAYAVSDALILPSDAGETWGLVANEAMAAGLTVVVSDLPGCAGDLVVDGETGRVVPFGDVVALRNAIADLAGDREALAKMKRASRKHVANYSFQAIVDGVKQALRAVGR